MAETAASVSLAPDPHNPDPRDRPRVGLFVTCLVDLIRPSVAFAAVKLLEDAGCTVEVPTQTCCGQPAFNSGDRMTAREIAAQVVVAFAPFDSVVAPSGSCAGMLKLHYPELFRDDPTRLAAAEAFAAKTYELISFLTDMRGVTRVDAAHEGRATYHDACSGLRELGVRAQPRKLLASVRGLSLTEMAGYLMQNVPPKPQQVSAPGNSVRCRPSTLRNS